MSWNTEKQARFDQLRRAELSGPLSSSESAELAELLAELEADEVLRLGPGMTAARQEQAARQRQLGLLQNGNEALAKLLSQQEQLAADARRWLAELEERHRLIQKTYALLMGQPLGLSSSS